MFYFVVVVFTKTVTGFYLICELSKTENDEFMDQSIPAVTIHFFSRFFSFLFVLVYFYFFIFINFFNFQLLFFT